MSHEERLEYLRSLTGETISPAQLARIIGGRPYVYNLMAREGKLTLPHVWRGRNLRIFKAPLLTLLQGGVICSETAAGAQSAVEEGKETR